MRLRTVGIAALGVLWAGAATANTFVFGTATNSSSCSTAGNTADRNCTNANTVTNGALDNTATFNVRGQASADHGITTNPTAIADMTVTYDIPYTVTRTISIPDVNGGDPVFANVPIQTISFDITFSGSADKDNSQIGGGLGQATVFTASFSDPNVPTRFTTTNYNGAAVTGGGGLTRTPFTRTTPDPSFTTSANFSGGAAGEISFLLQIPTDYRLWTDNVAPMALPYAGGPNSVTQSFTDTLRISFRLRAESRPSGSVSVTGGEALACAGQTSPLGAFDLDDGANCGSGLTVVATSTVGSTQSIQIGVPEPLTVGLLGSALAGLLWVGARSRRRD